jgi:hypothetical protein
VNDQIQHQPAVSIANNGVSAAVALRAYERVPRTRRVAIRERVTNVDGCCTIEYIAGFLGHTDLRERMVLDGLIQADGLPYQHYLDCGYLVAVEGDDTRPEVLVTPWGMSWLLSRYPMTDEARCTHHAAKAIQ